MTAAGLAYSRATGLMRERGIVSVTVALETTHCDDRIDSQAAVVRVEYADGRVHSWAPRPLAELVWAYAGLKHGHPVPADSVTMTRPGAGVRLESAA